jgi:predicted esterase
MSSEMDVSKIPVNNFRPWKTAQYFLQPSDNDGAKLSIGVRKVISNEVIMRIFYPAQESASCAKPASWFRTSAFSSLDGYIHVFAGGLWRFARHGSILFEMLRFFGRCIAFALPLRGATLPYCYEDLPPRRIDGHRAPVVIWSHGLTGNSDEHGLLAATLAADGNIVALVHHQDGSSSFVEQADGSVLYYQHTDLRNYDSSMRQRQAERRASELSAARAAILAGAAGADLAALADPARAAVGGFSFGAAAAAAAAAAPPPGAPPCAWRCAVLWDGWFHLELSSIGLSADMPTQAFDRASLPRQPVSLAAPPSACRASRHIPGRASLPCEEGDLSESPTASRLLYPDVFPFPQHVSSRAEEPPGIPLQTDEERARGVALK